MNKGQQKQAVTEAVVVGKGDADFRGRKKGQARFSNSIRDIPTPQLVGGPGSDSSVGENRGRECSVENSQLLSSSPKSWRSASKSSVQ
jgi:hypothetical protein